MINNVKRTNIDLKYNQLSQKYLSYPSLTNKKQTSNSEKLNVQQVKIQNINNLGAYELKTLIQLTKNQIAEHDQQINKNYLIIKKLNQAIQEQKNQFRILSQLYYKRTLQSQNLDMNVNSGQINHRESDQETKGPIQTNSVFYFQQKPNIKHSKTFAKNGSQKQQSQLLESQLYEQNQIKQYKGLGLFMGKGLFIPDSQLNFENIKNEKIQKIDNNFNLIPSTTYKVLQKIQENSFQQIGSSIKT